MDHYYTTIPNKVINEAELVFENVIIRSTPNSFKINDKMKEFIEYEILHKKEKDDETDNKEVDENDPLTAINKRNVERNLQKILETEQSETDSCLEIDKKQRYGEWLLKQEETPEEKQREDYEIKLEELIQKQRKKRIEIQKNLNENICKITTDQYSSIDEMKADATKTDATKTDATKADATKTDATKADDEHDDTGEFVYQPVLMEKNDLNKCDEIEFPEDVSPYDELHF